ncbi:MAG TPA: TlpA disulfide reductase family protein [Candidatus Nanopelagicales bacterium]
MTVRLARTAATAAAVLLTAGLLAGCGTQDGNDAAGQRLAGATQSEQLTPVSGEPVPSAATLARARLEPCPASATSATSPPVSGGLPDLTLPCLGGGPAVNLAGLRGTPMVLTLWAQYCGPCRDELPVFAQAAKAAQRAGISLRFLGIDLLEPRPDAAVALLADSGVHFPSVRDDSGATRASLKWIGPPTTVFVRADGTVAWTQIGQIPDAATLRGLIRTHLGVAVPA